MGLGKINHHTMKGDTSVLSHRMNNLQISPDQDYIKNLYHTYQEAENVYAESRASRIRAAMFADCDSPGTSQAPPSRFGLVERMSDPARQIRTDIVELLSIQQNMADMTVMSVPDLVKLMSDSDPSIVARAVQRVHLLCKGDATIADYPQLVERLFEVARSDNVDIKREAVGALAKISDHRNGRMHLFRSGGLAELIRMLHSPIEGVVRYAVTTLHNLLMHLPDIKAQARALGAIEALSHLLFSSNHVLLAKVSDCIFHLLHEDQQSMMIFLSLGGPQTLMHIMHNYSDRRKLIYTVIRCIRSLSSCPKNKDALISLDCMPALYTELCRSSDERSQREILISMRNLSNVATNEENLTPLIIRLLDFIRTSDDYLTGYACEVLSNLTYYHLRNKQTVCSNDGVRAAVDAIRRFPHVEDVTVSALYILRHCTRGHDMAEQAQHDLRLSGAFPHLLSLLTILRAPVIKAVLCVVGNAAFLETNRIELTQMQTDSGDTFISLSLEIWARAMADFRNDQDSEADGVLIIEIIEQVVYGLQQLAKLDKVASDLLAADPNILFFIEELLVHPEVANSTDNKTLTETVNWLLALLGHLARVDPGAVEGAGFVPILEDYSHSQKEEISEKALVVLKKLGINKPAAYRSYPMGPSSEWQRDGMEHGSDGNWYDTDL